MHARVCSSPDSKSETLPTASSTAASTTRLSASDRPLLSREIQPWTLIGCGVVLLLSIFCPDRRWRGDAPRPHGAWTSSETHLCRTVGNSGTATTASRAGHSVRMEALMVTGKKQQGFLWSPYFSWVVSSFTLAIWIQRTMQEQDYYRLPTPPSTTPTKWCIRFGKKVVIYIIIIIVLFLNNNYY